MSTISKILGQEKPAAATDIVLYTVPDGVEAEVNMFLCNQSVDSDKFRIALVSSGEALAEKHYIFYDSVINGNYTVNITGISLNTGDTIHVYSKNGNISFTATGLEVS